MFYNGNGSECGLVLKPQNDKKHVNFNKVVTGSGALQFLKFGKLKIK